MSKKRKAALTEGNTRAGMKKIMAEGPDRPPPSPNLKKKKGKVIKAIKVATSRPSKADLAYYVDKVNCVNLVPPNQNSRRWHCEQQNGQQGDCPLFLDKNDNCDWYLKKFTPLTEDQINEKILERRQRAEHVEQCVKFKLCPNDGHDLHIHHDDDDNHEPLDELWCPICDFVHTA